LATVERLSPTPPVPLDGPVVAGADFSSSTAAQVPSATGPGPPAADPPHLPATGYEAPTAALLGAGLLATALGLRRLTVDGRRF
jgi:LPXTG-motif cell wall-anchored protein